jgi:hypothetical protein
VLVRPDFHVFDAVADVRDAPVLLASLRRALALS